MINLSIRFLQYFLNFITQNFSATVSTNAYLRLEFTKVELIDRLQRCIQRCYLIIVKQISACKRFFFLKFMQACI